MCYIIHNTTSELEHAILTILLFAGAKNTSRKKIVGPTMMVEMDHGGMSCISRSTGGEVPNVGEQIDQLLKTFLSQIVFFRHILVYM
jgi:hypothetical protein